MCKTGGVYLYLVFAVASPTLLEHTVWQDHVPCNGAAVLQLLPRKEQLWLALLAGRLLMDLALHCCDGVAGPRRRSDHGPVQKMHKDPHGVRRRG